MHESNGTPRFAAVSPLLYSAVHRFSCKVLKGDAVHMKALFYPFSSREV
jgi:hypothetical protein